ncbi:MAG: hemerythrin domain-containing protein [Segetibacter sp.]
MEKKPIKRNENIVQLSKDHHFTLLFCWKIRKGLKLEVEQDRIKKYVHYFWHQHMQPHFLAEETILFRPVKDEAVQRAFGDHAQIAQRITALDAGGGHADELSALADLVDNHVRYEERELFPHLEKVLTNEQLESIGKQISTQCDPSLKDKFADEFWVP